MSLLQNIQKLPKNEKLTENYLEEEARKGRRENFEKVMKAVPCVEPDEHDRI